MLRVGDVSFSSFFTSSKASGPRLRVGVLLDGPRVARAYASVLDDIRSSNFVDVALVALNSSTPRDSDHAWPRRLLSGLLVIVRDPRRMRGLMNVGWSLYVRLDRRRVRLENDPLSAEDCGDMLQGVESIGVRPFTIDGRYFFPEEVLTLVRSRRLDVILQFGFSGLSGGILDAARYGVWEFRHGDSDRYRGGPAYFWEMVEGNPVSGVALERQTDGREPGLILAKAYFPTDMGSHARNRVQPYFGSTHMVIQKLKELHESGWEHVAARAVEPSPYTGRRHGYRPPTNMELARWIGPRLPGKLIDRVARSLLGRTEVGHWRIAIRPRRMFALEGNFDMSGFRWIEAPPGHMYADPFIAERDGRTWLFVEDLSYSEQRAVISCAEVTAEGALGSSQVILSSDGHVSYPYVFFDGPTAYMVPETSAEGAVRLYRAADFPHRWELQAEIYPGAAVDTSVVKQDDRWWFFTTLREPRGKGMMLVLFYAETLDGPWIFHPMNPISADVRNIRGAGSIYRQEGMLIRPSQDCSLTYGYKFTMHEIVKLSPTVYEERQLVSIGPEWNPLLLATHTYNRGGSIEVTDGAVRRDRSQIA